MSMADRNTGASWQDMDEGGFILWETLVSLPVLAMLLLGVSSIFLYAMRLYWVNLADAELQQEVHSAFVRVMEDVLRGEAIVDTGHPGQSFAIVSKADPLGKHTGEEETREDGKFLVPYWLHQMEGSDKLIRGGRADSPLTGDHTLAQVTIVEISATKDAAYPGVYRLRLKGRSEVTQHEYTLSSAVYLPRR